MTATCSTGRTAGQRWSGLLDRIAAEVSAGEDGFLVAGNPRPVPGLDRVEARQAVRAAVADELYTRYYLHHGRPPAPAAGTRPHDRRPAFAREDAAFGHRIRAAVGGRYRWEDGWRVLRRIDGGVTLVARNHLVLHVRDKELRQDGDRTAIRFPADHPYASPGYFVVTGTAGAQPAGPTVRVYLNLRADPAPTVFGAIVALLDVAGLRYSAKLLNDPQAYTRPDAAVVYVPRADLPVARAVVLAHRNSEPAAFGSAEPAFTARLAPGIGLADEPVPTGGTPVSFGQHRCGILARGLLAAGAGAAPAERRAAMDAELRRAGVDPARPHLNPDGVDYDDLLVGTAR